MILFTLRCARGHQFEGWFRDGDGFEVQQKAGEISCPECGETKVHFSGRRRCTRNTGLHFSWLSAR
jgi:hypothetical protein